MGQADAAPRMPRYDPYLRRACAERALKLRDRNYGYRIVSGGGIVERQLGSADSIGLFSMTRKAVITSSHTINFSA